MRSENKGILQHVLKRFINMSQDVFIKTKVLYLDTEKYFVDEL